MPSCCGRSFSDNQALTQHRAAKHHRHHSCQKCNRSFGTLIGLQDHDRDLHGSRSGKTKRNPATTTSSSSSSSSQNVVDRLKKNNNGGDRYCGECRKHFADAAALRQHLQSAAHASEFRCCDCKRNFVSTEALMQHLEDKVHKPKPAALRLIPDRIIQTTCHECKRQFRSNEALRQHQSSKIHQPARPFGCAAATGGVGSGSCSRRFGSPAAMLQHLESGACSSGMNRQKLNLLVLRSDHRGLFSSSSSSSSSPAVELVGGGEVQDLLHEATHRLVKATASSGGAVSAIIGSRDDVVSLWSSGSSTGGVILTPSTSIMSSSLASPILTPTSGYMYSSALAVPTTNKGGDGTRCPLCPPTRRPFPSRQSLQQHLQSPVHDARIFRCPVSPLMFTGLHGQQRKKATTVKWFSTISGMGQHVESGACAIGGLAGFGTVLRNIATRVRSLDYLD